MKEPYLFAMPDPPDPGIWRQRAPVDFKDPSRGIYLIPVTQRILDGERGLYTEDEIRTDPKILEEAMKNTRSNRLRRNLDNDFASLRSDNTQIPCIGMFFMDNRDKILKALRVDPSSCYLIFITPDEVLLAEKEKFRPTGIRRMIQNIVNQIKSNYPEDAPILCPEVMEYGPDGRYREV